MSEIQKNLPSSLKRDPVEQIFLPIVLTVAISVGGIIGNHYMRMKYDIRYRESHSSSPSLHIPNWDETDVFRVGTMILLEGLKR